jgi:FkbM family methyltransferase
MQDGTFEHEEIHEMQRLLESSDVFVDVGANIGLYTCLARSRGAQVIAVEPLARNLQYLFANLDANGWTDTEVWPVALAERAGTAVLSGASTGASLVEGWAGASPLLRTRTAVSTLDIIMGIRFPSRRLLIKIDVEGAEWRLLQGASETLRRTPAPVWMVEVNLVEHHPAGRNERFQSTFELFWDCGYQSFSTAGERRDVGRAEVEQWVADPASAPRGGNYLFSHL